MIGAKHLLFKYLFVNSILGQENKILPNNYKVIVPFNKSYRKIQWPLVVIVKQCQNQPF